MCFVCAYQITAVSGQHNGSLIVCIKSHQMCEWLKHLANESLEPKSFFWSVDSSDILRFHCGNQNELLFLQAPENSSPIDNKGKSGYSASIFLDSSISVNISNEISYLNSKSECEWLDAG